MKLIGRVDTSEGHYSREKDALLASLNRKGLIATDAILDDILSLSAEDILNRRLQAQVYYKGLACSMKQARQLVTHGQICIGDQKVTIPSYPVTRDEEELIRYHPRSKLNDENHIIRQTILEFVNLLNTQKMKSIQSFHNPTHQMSMNRLTMLLRQKTLL